MFKLNSDQRQVIIGTLLGSGRLEAGPDGIYLLMKSRDLYWLESKAHILSDLTFASWRSRGNYYWRSKADECFVEFDKLCYEGTEKIARMECLDALRDIGMAVWYGDVGCRVGRNRMNACLRTQSLGDSNSTVIRFFNEIDMPCKMNLVRRKPVCVFTQTGSLMLFKIVAAYLPSNRPGLLPSA